MEKVEEKKLQSQKKTWGEAQNIVEILKIIGQNRSSKRVS